VTGCGGDDGAPQGAGAARLDPVVELVRDQRSDARGGQPTAANRLLADGFKSYAHPTATMTPAIMPDDRVVADLRAYDGGEPVRRGDIVLFTPTEAAVTTCGAPSADQPFLMRVVGLPGDTVRMRRGALVVDGSPATEAAEVTAASYEIDWPVVPAGEYLVLGDNRNESCDAHVWSPDPFVPRDTVLGRVVAVYHPGPHAHMLVEE
jgi:signal peptidase I